MQIGTIHSVKGLEADAVVLSPAYTSKMLETFKEEDPVEERRLYYVALTRAKEAVYIAHDFHGGEEYPPLSSGL